MDIDEFNETQLEQQESDDVVLEDPIEKRKLILTIQNYYALPIFGKVLAKFPQDLENKSHAELENILKDVKFTVANVTSGSFVTAAFSHGIQTLESVSKYTSLDLTGLHDSLSKEQETYVLLEEIRLKHQSYTYVRPEYRLMYLVTRTALACHAKNKSMKGKVKSKLDEKADPKLVAELNKLEVKN